VDTCFVAMPMTTPAALVDGYDNDPDHFLHVLEHLFIPPTPNWSCATCRP
jgi:hypothetical protein